MFVKHDGALLKERDYWMRRCELCRLCTAAGDVMTITMLLASLNSCVNPWIYVFFINNVRLSGLACHCCCCRCPGGRNVAGRRRTSTSAVVNVRHLDDT